MKTCSAKENIFIRSELSKFCSRTSFYHCRVEYIYLYVAFANWTAVFEFVDCTFSTIGMISWFHIEDIFFKKLRWLQENERFGGAIELSQVTCVSCLKIKVDLSTESKLIKGYVWGWRNSIRIRFRLD